MKLTPVEVMSELYDLAYNMHLVFERHKLSYFLAFGSAVGAIRHGGIIPWDDDLDVIINEESEELFLSKVQNELLKDKKIRIVEGSPDSVWDYKLVSVLRQSKLFPTCDVFVMRLDITRKMYTFRNVNLKNTRNHKFNESAMHPKLINFGHFQMRVLSNDSYEYLFNEYSKYWRSVASTKHYDHYADLPLIRMTFHIPKNLSFLVKSNKTI